MRWYWWLILVVWWWPGQVVQAEIELGLDPTKDSPLVVAVPPPVVGARIRDRIQLPFLVEEWSGSSAVMLPLLPNKQTRVTGTIQRENGTVVTGTSPTWGNAGVDLLVSELPLVVKATFLFSATVQYSVTTKIVAYPTNLQSIELNPAQVNLSAPEGFTLTSTSPEVPGVELVNGSLGRTLRTVVDFFNSGDPDPKDPLDLLHPDQHINVNQLPPVTATPGQSVTLAPYRHRPAAPGATVRTLASIAGKDVGIGEVNQPEVTITAPSVPGVYDYTLKLEYQSATTEKPVTFISGKVSLTVNALAPLTAPLLSWATLPLSTLATTGAKLPLPPGWLPVVAPGEQLVITVGVVSGPAVMVVQLVSGALLIPMGTTQTVTAAQATSGEWQLNILPNNRLVPGHYQGELQVTVIRGP
ncbi:hypothetical protein [Lacticaseibacillus nasuensis]|uniref:hypothetical protein n=1 Tax=Lacticaseibacillus nasuensis TaxID=944671 RepID=UPI0022462671|nr:hypothetical protein [Lacticaseibacillus nasuensis]MCX2455796.1 hypothetical protein [Lacticaseibacillus nasuensis]